MYKDTKELNDQFVELGFKPGYNKKTMLNRIDFIDEELQELIAAVDKDDHAEALDALVDLTVVILGTAYQMDWDFQKAWDKVHKANMEKTAVKGEAINNRAMSFDLKKPYDWLAPDLEDCV